jgi:hypothetical protein
MDLLHIENPDPVEIIGASDVFENKSLVFTDLINAEENGKGHLAQLFNSTKLQKEKDLLIDTMQFHLTKYRPIVQLSEGQERRKNELTSQIIFGNSLLQ